jgi:hypothetical protein
MRRSSFLTLAERERAARIELKERNDNAFDKILISLIKCSTNFDLSQTLEFERYGFRLLGKQERECVWSPGRGERGGVK